MKLVNLHRWKASVHKAEKTLACSLVEEVDMGTKSQMLPAWRARYWALVELLAVPVGI